MGDPRGTDEAKGVAEGDSIVTDGTAGVEFGGEVGWEISMGCIGGVGAPSWGRGDGDGIGGC